MQSDRIQLPRLKIVHLMIVAGVFAVVFAVLNTRPGDSTLGLAGLFAIVGGVWFAVTMFRGNPLKAVLESLPDDPDAQIVALEAGLAQLQPL